MVEYGIVDYRRMARQVLEIEIWIRMTCKSEIEHECARMANDDVSGEDDDEIYLSMGPRLDIRFEASISKRR